MSYPAFTFPWSPVGPWFVNRRRRNLVNLPNDVFLEEIFTRLDVWSVISVRRVNKRLYALTHEPVIWKRFLRGMNVPLHPLPPTPRYSIAALNNLEVERLLVRAFSLGKNFASRKPEPFFGTAVETFHHVQSMAILPGGKYLVASVREETQCQYAIIVFGLDYRIGGTLGLAKTSTPTKAYNLQAKYMTYNGEKGIMVSYSFRDIKYKKHRKAARRVNLSEMSSETTLDIPIPVKYTCTVLFTPLSSLDTLSDPVVFHPGSKAYNQFAMEQIPPFRLLASVRSSFSLGPICLGEVFGAPYMAVVKGNDQIVIKNLLVDGYSTLVCKSFDLPIEDNTIAKIRLLPPQGSIFVVRCIKEYGTLFETYDLPYLNERVIDTDPAKSILLPRFDLERIEITDNPPLASRHYNLDMDSAPDLTSQASRTISIFGTTVPDPVTKTRTICRIGLVAKPWTKNRPLPRVPFPLDSKVENNPEAKEAFIREYATHFYEIQSETTPEPFGFSQKYGKMRVLPGSNYSLVYWTADSIKDCSNLTNLGIYFTPTPLGDEGDEAESFEVEQVLIGGKMMGKKNLRIKFPYMWKELWGDLKSKPVRCMAWDESIGRMCVVHENDSRIFVVDFAQAPREDAKGERLPLPVTLYQNPTKSSLFCGRFFCNTKL